MNSRGFEAVVDNLDVLLINQREIYFLHMDDAKQRISHRLRLSIYTNLLGHITPYALKLIHEEYLRITAVHTALPPCKHIFTTTTGLPCSHRIHDRMFDRAGGGTIPLEDVHPHWRFDKPPVRNEAIAEIGNTPPPDDNVDMRIRSPDVIMGKERPRGYLGPLTRSEQRFEDSSQREPSGFERVENALQSQLPHRPRGRPRGSGRERGRGGTRRGGKRVLSKETDNEDGGHI